MDGASLIIGGNGEMSNGQVKGGVDSVGDATAGAAVGAGMFLQGSGILDFTLTTGQTFTVNDPIVDESGAVSDYGLTSAPDLPPGPDGLRPGGGSGVWGVRVAGAGSLVLKGHHAFSGYLNADQSIVDLSAYTGGKHANDVTLKNSARLVFRPGISAQPLQLRQLSFGSGDMLALNGYSLIAAQSLQGESLRLELDATGFSRNTPVKVLEIRAPAPGLKVTANSGYEVKFDGMTIVVTRSAD